MYPSSARLVPDDQSDERAFFARDLDEERNLSKQTVKRGHRHDAMRRPSLGTRILKLLARFFAAVLIGIGLTLAWQSYGEQAKQFTTTARHARQELAGDERSLAEFGPHFRQLSLVIGELTVRLEERV